MPQSTLNRIRDISIARTVRRFKERGIDADLYQVSHAAHLMTLARVSRSDVPPMPLATAWKLNAFMAPDERRFNIKLNAAMNMAPRN